MNLDEFDDIRASEDTKNKTLEYVMRKQNKKSYTKPIFVMTVCSLVLFLLPIAFLKQKPQQTTTSSEIISYVSIDVNPSMEWVINENDIIIDIISYNNDVENLSFVSSLKGKTLIDGMNMMIKDTAFQDYMKDGFLEIGIYSEHKNQESKLQKQIDDYLQTHLSTSKYHCSCSNKDTFEQSRQHQISFGKYNVIKEILQYDVSYTEQELQEKSMRELYDILSNFDQSVTQKGKHNQNGKQHQSGMHKKYSN